MSKHLTTKKQRLAYVDWDYNDVDVAADLSGLRHRAFIPGNGESLTPDIVFLFKCPTHIETIKGDIRDGIHMKLVKSLCEDAGIENYYLTYLIKYELRGQRDPRPLEAETALAFVREELSILDPFIIVLVGENMHNLIFPNLPFSEAQGKIIHGAKGTYFPISDVTMARRHWSAYADVADEFFNLGDALDVILNHYEEKDS